MGKYERVISKRYLWGVDFLMILVILGTQDKEFPRLLKAIDQEIEKGVIKDKVIVQAGQTKYHSEHMEIFDLLPAPEFEKLMDQADLIITHGGAGSILSAIKKGKKVIAAARLAKYKEHHNDHQKQIIEEFASLGYILELKDFHKLGKLIEKSRNFKPKKFESNTPNMIKLIEDYIENSNHTSWFNKSYPLAPYGIYAVVNFIIFWILSCLSIDTYLNVVISFVITSMIAVTWQKTYQRKVFLLLPILLLVLDLGGFYLIKMPILLLKLVINIIIVLLSYIYYRLFL